MDTEGVAAVITELEVDNKVFEVESWVLDAEAVERLVDLTIVELDWTVLDSPFVELLNGGNGGFVDDAEAGVVALVAAELSVLLCTANLFAAPRSRLRSKRNNVRRNDRMENIVEARKRPVQAGQAAADWQVIQNDCEA